MFPVKIGNRCPWRVRAGLHQAVNDSKIRLDVRYDGAKPDMLKMKRSHPDGQTGWARVFIAEELLLKCPCAQEALPEQVE